MTPPRTDQIRQLARLRLFYLKNLEEAANGMAEMDRKIAILESQELEADLLQSENQ
jgi:hypothetical protein